MAQIPTTYARTQVPSPGGAPQMGRKLNIHAHDAAFEQERQNIRNVAKTIQNITGAAANVAMDWAKTQKAKEDKLA